MRSLLLAVCCAALTLTAEAQKPKPTPAPPPAPPAATAPAPAAPSSPQPVITELQNANMQLYQSKIDYGTMVGQALSSPWQQKKQDLIQELLKANPDYTWHDAQGQGDYTGLILKPKPQPAATPAAPTPTPPPEPGK